MFRLEPFERRRLLAALAAGPEFRVNTNTLSDQDAATIASNPIGNCVIAWTSNGQDGSGLGIYAQRLDSTGALQGAEFRVNTFTIGNQRIPAVAIDTDGDFVIAWESRDQDGSAYGVYARRFVASGAPVGDEFRVNSTTISEQGEASIGIDAVGNFVIAWESLGQDGSGFGVFSQRYDSMGVPQGGEFQVNSGLGTQQGRPAVSMNCSGDFVIAWHSQAQTDPSYDIYARRYDPAGNALGDEFRVNQYTSSRQFNCTVAMRDSGEFAIAWQSLGADGSGESIAARRYDATGSPASDEFLVNNTSSSNQSAPAVALTAAGECLIAWQSDGHPISSGGAEYDIYARRYGVAGAARGLEFRVNSFVANNQLAPSAAVRSNGDFVVSWQSFGQDGSDDGIYAQRYSLAPYVLTASFEFQVAPHELRFRFDESVLSTIGIDDLLVENLTTGATIPETNFALVYDTQSDTAKFDYVGTNEIAGVLPRGNYRATLRAAGVATPNGAQLTMDHVVNFQFLPADADNNGVVNLVDFNLLAANFNLFPRTFSQGDFNYDGVVNLLDFNILAAHFNTVLASPWRKSAGQDCAAYHHSGYSTTVDLLSISN